MVYFFGWDKRSLDRGTMRRDEDGKEIAMALETEIKTYESRLDELLAYEGKYVVINGQDVIGTFDSYADALQAAYSKFPTGEFLVKRIQAVEQVQFIARA